jgi:hypothetical protein
MISEIKSLGNNQEFSPKYYIYHMVLKIISVLTFGEKYKFGDKKLSYIYELSEYFNNEVMKFMLIEFMPICKYFIKLNTEKSKGEFNKIGDMYTQSFENCKTTYQNGNCDNFATSLITTRNKLLENEKDTAKYSSDINLKSVLASLFAGFIIPYLFIIVDYFIYFFN